MKAHRGHTPEDHLRGVPRSERSRDEIARKPREPWKKPPLRLFTTTLWEYPSQHYGDQVQGDKRYIGATPSWIIWQLLQRYSRENDLVIDPMCGSGTTLDVARDLKRRALGYDLAPTRSDIFRADARRIPVEDSKADFVFIDPPYSTHVDYSDDPRCIGRLSSGGEDDGQAYYSAMRQVISDIHRVLRDRRYMALYVSDSFRKAKAGGQFMPIGFELFSILREFFRPVDIVCVVRHNAKLAKGNWNKAAEEGNFFLRGFNYLFIMKKEVSENSGKRSSSDRHPAPEPRPSPAPSKATTRNSVRSGRPERQR